MNFLLKSTLSTCVLVAHVSSQGVEPIPSPASQAPTIATINLTTMLASANAIPNIQEKPGQQLNGKNTLSNKSPIGRSKKKNNAMRLKKLQSRL